MAQGLAVGAAGGALCWLVGLPAPWLAGSMLAAIVAAFAGVEIEVADWLKSAAFILLGIQTGTAVTWETVERAAQWPLSIFLLAITVVAVTWACSFFYTRARRWDPATALFSSLPGALSLVILLAGEASADMRRVTIAQCIRLFFLIAALPAVITWITPSGAQLLATAEIGSLADITLVIILSAGAGLLFEKLRVPAGLILGPTLASAVLELSGAISGALPGSLLIPANVVLGVMIAARFGGFSFAAFRRALGEGFAGFTIALVVAGAGAGLASAFTGLPFALTLLAFAPGGLEAMTIMSFALGLDPAYVAAHQVARYVGIAVMLPWVSAALLRRLPAAEPAPGSDD